MDPFKNRRWVIILIIISVGFIFSLRLFYIQVINHDWSKRASQISLKSENIQPPRGFIYDRNNKLLVGAETVYDIYILPISIRKNDTLKICELFNFSKSDFYEINYFYLNHFPEHYYFKLNIHMKRASLVLGTKGHV